MDEEILRTPQGEGMMDKDGVVREEEEAGERMKGVVEFLCA